MSKLRRMEFYSSLNVSDLTAASRVWVGVKRRFFFSVRPEVLALSRVLLARAADFLFFLAMPAFVTASSFCFSLASFFAPFCRRASSRRIFLLRFLGFIGISCASARAANGALDFELMTKPHQCHAIVCPALKPRLRRLFARGVYAVGVPSLLAKCQCLTVMTLLPDNLAAVIQGVRANKLREVLPTHQHNSHGPGRLELEGFS